MVTTESFTAQVLIMKKILAKKATFSNHTFSIF